MYVCIDLRQVWQSVLLWTRWALKIQVPQRKRMRMMKTLKQVRNLQTHWWYTERFDKKVSVVHVKIHRWRTVALALPETLKVRVILIFFPQDFNLLTYFKSTFLHK